MLKPGKTQALVHISFTGVGFTSCGLSEFIYLKLKFNENHSLK